MTNFKTSESWVILSDLEKGIKAKIEAIGTRIKDWDVNIYRGILTGYNEAFIIDDNKRKELISEDPKSADIIRPILRGRDIKRYGYDFANLWLINSHNGLKEKSIKPISIEDYPAIKKHLNSYYPQLVKRLDKGDTIYNLRNCAYMEDFYRQKIVWKRIGSILRFSYDDSGAMALDSTCFATGKNIKYLVGVLNSKFGKYLIKDSPKTGTGDLLISVQAIEPLLLKIPDELISKKIEAIVDQILIHISLGENYNDLENEINSIIYQQYNFTESEIQHIESH